MCAYFTMLEMGCWGGSAIGSDITTTAVTIATILPTVKLLVSIRNPTDRAYSHFWHFAGPCYDSYPKRDAACFHNLAIEQVGGWVDVSKSRKAFFFLLHFENLNTCLSSSFMCSPLLILITLLKGCQSSQL
jgi:hypothetical protein